MHEAKKVKRNIYYGRLKWLAGKLAAILTKKDVNAVFFDRSQEKDLRFEV